MRVLALTRAPQFSPNSVEKDHAILMAVAERLRLRGAEVEVLSETDEAHEEASRDAILSMGRLPETLEWLKEQEARGIRVINRPEAVALCSSRSSLSRLMQEHNVPMPQTNFKHPTSNIRHQTSDISHQTSDISHQTSDIRHQTSDISHPTSNIKHQTSNIKHQTSTFPVWLKRGDACAQSKDDVVFCRDGQELEAAMRRFANRGITDWVVSGHVEGDLVKFYGVRGTGFFRHFYPTDDHETKFNDEQHNGTARHYAFDAPEMHAEVERLAAIVGIDVYGGDAIVSNDGTFFIIDFNDWPSFSRCREEAAGAIASLI